MLDDIDTGDKCAVCGGKVMYDPNEYITYCEKCGRDNPIKVRIESKKRSFTHYDDKNQEE